MGPDEIEQIARAVAREEIASLCGLVLQTANEQTSTSGRVRAEARAEVLSSAIMSAFGEALRDFGSTTTEPGE